MKVKKILGVDIGGSGIKGAIINTKTGEMLTPRFRIETPVPATPVEVAATVHRLAKHYAWDGAIGIGFPAVIKEGVAKTAANVDTSFIDTDVNALFSNVTGSPVFCVNDADAAGIAEMRYGAGKNSYGVVILITVGTGLGTVIFSKGKLIPNTELGHITLPNAQEAELYSSDAVRKNNKMGWEEWGKRFNEYLQYMEKLFWPDVFIIGGGVSKDPKTFMPYLTVKSKVVPAVLQNNAGMIGAAIYARQRMKALYPQD